MDGTDPRLSSSTSAPSTHTPSPSAREALHERHERMLSDGAEVARTDTEDGHGGTDSKYEHGGPDTDLRGGRESVEQNKDHPRRSADAKGVVQHSGGFAQPAEPAAEPGHGPAGLPR